MHPWCYDFCKFEGGNTHKRVVSLKILDMCDSVVCMLDSKDEQPNGWVVHVYVGVWHLTKVEKCNGWLIFMHEPAACAMTFLAEFKQARFRHIDFIFVIILFGCIVSLSSIEPGVFYIFQKLCPDDREAKIFCPILALTLYWEWRSIFFSRSND